MKAVKNKVHNDTELYAFTGLVKQVDSDPDNFVHREVQRIIERRLDRFFRILFRHRYSWEREDS